MAAPSIINYLNALTGMFDKEVYRDYWPRSPWLSLIRRGTWPDHIGTTISTVVYGRNAPAVANPTWTPINITSGLEGGACLPQPEIVTPGYRVRQYSLAQRALKGPHFCAENLRFSWEMEKQMKGIVDAFGGRMQIEWEIRDRFEYHKNCKYKVTCLGTAPVLNTNFTDTIAQPAAGADNAFIQTAPTSELTWGWLDAFRMKILRNGALLSALGMENGTPVLTAIVSAETAQSLRSAVQGDLRFGAPAKLLAPFGVIGSLKGYYLLEDMYPRRFNYTNGAFVQVPPFELDTTVTVGEDYKVNHSWETASYEESCIFDPMVYQQNIPAPLTNAGAGVVFNPTNYTGVFRLLNIPHEDNNPEGNIVFHFAKMVEGDEPLYPQRGVSYIHLRCDPAVAGLGCNSAQS